MIIKNGKVFNFANVDKTFDKLPIGTYVLRLDEKLGFVLEQIPSFIIPSKIYGDTQIVDKVINTFNTRLNKNLGVLFEGLKGCSKTLLCKMICQKINLPVILIQEDFDNVESDIIKFFSNPELGDCVIFFDEFDKIFKRHETQNPVLSLLDGTVSTHHLYLFTSNENVCRKEFINRPSRIYYHLIMDKIDYRVIKEIIEDKLNDKSKRSELLEILNNFVNLNFDTLISIIDEINRYDIPIKELVKDFGFSYDTVHITTHCIPVGETNEYDVTYDSTWTINTLLEIKCPIKGVSLKDDFKYGHLSADQIKRVNDHWEAFDADGNKYIIRRTKLINLLF